MRIVITGATGNLGTALLRRLASGGHHVVGVCRRPPSAGEPYDGVEWVTVDLAEPDTEAVLRPAVRGADAVVHLAWGFQPARDVDYLDRVGVGGTRAVLAATAAEGVPHLVHVSSLGAYSPAGGDRRVDEQWATEGVPSLAYSREKVAAERLLDEHEGRHPGAPDVARIRPALVVQPDAASALLRYFLPFYVPAATLAHLPVLPLDRTFRAQVVHSADVADALVRVLEQRATGAFNLAAEPPVTRDDVAAIFGARAIHLPYRALRAIVDASFRAHVQDVDPGWLDLAFQVPLMDTTRAREVLGWSPTVDGRAAVAQVVAGMVRRASTISPALRPRSGWEQARRLVRNGPIGNRRLP